MNTKKMIFALVLFVSGASISAAQTGQLPERGTPVPETTNGVPHVQIGGAPEPILSQKLLDRVAQLPGVTLGPTRVS